MEVHYIVQEAVIKIIPTKMQKGKKPLQIVMKRSEKQRRKGKIYPFECRVPKKSKER